MPKVPDTITIELSVAAFTEAMIALGTYVPEDEVAVKLGSATFEKLAAVRDEHIDAYGAQEMLDKALSQYAAVEA